MGYRLGDNGDSWRTSAAYRGGNNPSSVLVYKNSGVWYDYGQGIGPLPYRKLVSLTLKSDDESIIEKFLIEAQEFFISPTNEYIEMSKIYPNSVLEDLLPSYKFYLDKGISEGTLKEYQCGFCSSGRMYRRIVFPIFNSHKQIHGFSGRKIDNDNSAPKWLHTGKRREWVYPANLASADYNEIFLVESIGDSLALAEHGIKNHLVTFGLTPSSSLIGQLMMINPKKIVLAMNNDSHTSINAGRLSAIKTYISLLKVFDKDKLEIKLPTLNDFGEMHEHNMDFQGWLKQPYQTKEIIQIGSGLLSDQNVGAVFNGVQRAALKKLSNG